MTEAGNYVVATPGFAAQISRIARKTRGMSVNRQRLVSSGFMARDHAEAVLTPTFCYAYNRLYLAVQANVAIKKALDDMKVDPELFEESLDGPSKAFVGNLLEYYKAAFCDVEKASEALRVSREKWVKICTAHSHTDATLSEEYEVEIEYRAALERCSIQMFSVLGWH